MAQVTKGIFPMKNWINLPLMSTGGGGTQENKFQRP